MKKIYSILKTFLVCWIGVCIGRCIHLIWDHANNPQIYEIQSAPWQTGLYYYISMGALGSLILLIILYYMKKSIGEPPIS